MASLHVLVVEVPPAGRAAFAAYEDAVLPLLSDHGGRLERRLRHERADGGWTEVHIVAFEAAEGLEAYRQDPRRQAAQPLLVRSGATAQLLAAEDVAG